MILINIPNNRYFEIHRRYELPFSAEVIGSGKAFGKRE